jgi:hypothetical protein
MDEVTRRMPPSPGTAAIVQGFNAATSFPLKLRFSGIEVKIDFLKRINHCLFGRKTPGLQILQNALAGLNQFCPIGIITIRMKETGGNRRERNRRTERPGKKTSGQPDSRR